jgi:pimeloyl-[acyl-carrier protein] methyl ester esterase
MRHAPVVTPTLPGYGESSRIQTQGDELSSLAKAISQDLPHSSVLVGWSLGGLVAIRLARLLRRRTRALVLIAGTPCFGRRRDWVRALPAAQFAAMTARVRQDSRSALKYFADLASLGDRAARQVRAALRVADLSPPADVLLRDIDLLRTADLRQELKELQLPIRVILGARDRLVDAASRTALRELNPHIVVDVLELCAHAPFLSEPLRVAEILEEVRHGA